MLEFGISAYFILSKFPNRVSFLCTWWLIQLL